MHLYYCNLKCIPEVKSFLFIRYISKLKSATTMQCKTKSKL